jgi:tetratricopeptide (TPR) repeat protein
MSGFSSSLQADKSELFGSAGGGKPSARPTSSAPRSAPSAPRAPPGSSASSAARPSPAAPRSLLTAEQQRRKLAEAEDWRSQARAAMKKGFFSSADPLAAYSYYRKAAECYKATACVEREALIRASAAECSLATDSHQCAASEYKRAGECYAALDRYEDSCAMYRKSAEACAAAGDLARCGEMLMQGASELSRGGSAYAEEAGEKFEEALRVFVPDDLNSFAGFRSKPPEGSASPSPVVASAFAPELCTKAM